MNTDNPSGLSDQALATLAKAGINPLGYVVVRDLKPRLGVPFGVSTIWKKCAANPPEFPLPVRIGGITCWKVADVARWLEEQGQAAPGADTRGGKLTAARQKKRRQKAVPDELPGQG